MVKKLKIVFISLSLLSSFVVADINDDIQRKQAQDRRELELKKSLREQLKLKTKQQTILEQKVKSNIAESNKCVNIKQINISKQSLIEAQLINNLKQEYQNRCLGVKQINQLIKGLQNIYQTHGFVTSKVGLSVPQTKLKQGILDISIKIGFIDLVNFNSQNIDNTAFVKQLIFDDLINKPLNVNDISKRIDHVNRLNSHQAKLNIKPSKKQYHSEIVINDNKQDYQPFSVTFDNSGSKSTGVEKIKLNANWDDFLIPLSKWTLNYAFPAHTEEDKKDSNAYTLDVSFPYRDYLFNYNTTKSDYNTNQILTTGDAFYSFGNTTTKNFYLTKYLNKSNEQNNKIKLGLSLSDEESYSKLRGIITKNKVGSRKLSVLSLGYEHSFQLSDKSTLYLNPSIHRGIDAFDVLNDDESGLDTKAQFSLLKFYGYYAKPLELSKKRFNFMSSLNMQISEDALFAAQSFSIGGQGSVRGFKDESIAAKSGFYIQNNLSTNLNQWLGRTQDNSKIIGTIFFDYGRIHSSSSDYQSLSGAGISIKLQNKDIDTELTVAKNLKKPNSINEDSAIYFTISYKF
ncbi:hypothetical protein [uncultured Gammaproteobacteria bacterium]|jgi:hemolysin activation/secretion protein|uniref:ShlB/FhaC/HecB family hemolysin secretion/activation protein n=1 Tax=thiotrophic endosymbiont of Bathymodiolus puteoserpentis (Logatchev) TaxID=343240 RepID=UPI0010B0EC52|nr:ShlB/FhaC/HecB family hemolysin secretion/activation protein [thiotrophic endosymbiont of Bathymodiolus puteoserpentis (Logatchev)]CAC9489748.1 hypothetical protein [uncultured Gammaproteobacteria bacterium]CAC9580426.1 hypothetical protein [uncultured Gammaproteobacteria bacterium]CAC9629945.1 hypothetical protein [uncultured Gammaproteobacteria bacterium]CAC9952964.1 hypothetical protein [uncultured Gammaproteobacteria bacterium]SSC09385.1 hypothetical protein BPUTEOSOX_1028 [thiotrophic 